MLCESCGAVDHEALAAVLDFLKLSEGFSCTQFELTSLEGVDDQRLRRWLRMGVLEKSGRANVCLRSKLKKTDRRPPAVLLLRLLESKSAATHNLHIFEPKMITEELVVGDES